MEIRYKNEKSALITLDCIFHIQQFSLKYLLYNTVLFFQYYFIKLTIIRNCDHAVHLNTYIFIKVQSLTNKNKIAAQEIVIQD